MVYIRVRHTLPSLERLNQYTIGNKSVTNTMTVDQSMLLSRQNSIPVESTDNASVSSPSPSQSSTSNNDHDHDLNLHPPASRETTGITIQNYDDLTEYHAKNMWIDIPALHCCQ